MQRFDIRFHDPGQMPVALSAVTAGNFSIRPLRRGPFRSHVSAARLRDIGLFQISMSESRVITHDRLGFFSINVTLGEPFEAQIAGATERFDGKHAYIASPEDPFELHIPEQGRVLVMNVFRPQLDEYTQARSGREGAGRSTLPNRLSLSGPTGRSFLRILSFLWSESRSGSPLLESDRAMATLEDALLESLLLAADREPAGATAHLLEPSVRRAIDYIMANLDRPLSVGRIAAASGVHGRTLQRAFRTLFGAGVMGYVRDCRLDRAHAELIASGPVDTTVTDVAVANGFSHLGRFSAAYARRFGELPSETLRH